MASLRSACSASARAAARSFSIRRRSAATSITPAVSSSTVTPSATTDAVGAKLRAGGAEPQQRADAPLVAGQGAAGQPGERGGHLLPRAQPLVGAEPADLGHQPHQRGDLGLGRRVAGRRSASAPAAGAPGRWPGHGAIMTDSPPVSAVHSSSVTNGMTGWSSRSSASSTYPSTSRVVWPAGPGSAALASSRYQSQTSSQAKW